MRLKSLVAVVLLFGVMQAPAQAAEYQIDPEHSFVEFRIQHVGFSWMYGSFNEVGGSFTYDPENPDATQINVQIDPASVDTNHAERDKHLRSDDFLDVQEYPNASFQSTGYEGTADEGMLKGELTLHGQTRPISIEVTKIGEGEFRDSYRAGFLGTTTIDRRDFGIDYELGPASWDIEFDLSIEGIRQ